MVVGRLFLDCLEHRFARSAAPIRHEFAGGVFAGYTFSTWKCLAFHRGAVDFIGKTRSVEILVKCQAFARNGQIGGLSSANPMICSSLIPI
jgi:hypothetical protein